MPGSGGERSVTARERRQKPVGDGERLDGWRDGEMGGREKGW